MKLFGCYILIAVLLLGRLAVFSQSRKTDSLKKLTLKAKEDSNLVKTYLKLANALATEKNYSEAISSVNRAYSITEKLNLGRLGLNCLAYKSQLFLYGITKPDSVEKILYTLRKKARSLRNVHMEFNACMMMTDLCNSKAAFPKALEYSIEGLKIAEKNGDNESMAVAHKALGVAHAYLSDYATAIKEYNASRDIYLSVGDTAKANELFFVLGIAYYQTRDKVSGAERSRNSVLAIKCFTEGRRICLKENDIEGLHLINNELAGVYAVEGKYNKALECVMESYGYFKKNNEVEPAANSCNKIIGYLGLLKKHSEKLPFIQELYSLSVSSDNTPLRFSAMKHFSEYYENMGDYKTACLYHNRALKLHDSIFDNKLTQQSIEMAKKYETEKKDKELMKKDSEIKIQRAEARHASAQRNLFIAGFALMFVSTFLILRGYNQKKKAHAEINLQKQEVEKQKQLVEDKQHEILDSIHYAKRIQHSLITSYKYIEKTLNRLKENNHTT